MPMGAMMPVMRMSIGATSAERTPPAPKRDQKMGSWERFISHPPHDDVDQHGNRERRGPAARGDQEVGYRLSPDPQVRRRLRRDFPPRVRVVADGEECEPVKKNGVRARQH